MDGFDSAAWYLLLAYILLFVFLLCVVLTIELTSKCCPKYANNEENENNLGGIEELEDNLELIIWD